MDSNKANIGTFYLTIAILILTAIAVGIMAYNQIYPPTRDVQNVPIETMNRWVPIAFITSLLALAIMLQIFLGIRLRKNKHLRLEIGRLTADLDTARTKAAHQQSFRNIATLEAGNIQVGIKLLGCTLLYKNLDGPTASINFNFHILNMSVYSLEVEKSVAGWIDFAGNRMGGHLRRTDSNGGFAHGQSSYLIVTQWLSKEDVTNIRASNQQCSFTFKNLEVWVKSTEKDIDGREIPKGRVQLACHIERSGQGALDNDPVALVTSLRSQLADTQWLKEIALDEAQTIYRFVHLTLAQIGNHELLRDNPYLEFLLSVDNRSLYDIAFDDLSGTIGFAGRELTYHPVWQERLPIKHGDSGQVIIRQKLTRGDVTQILNGLPTDKFGFHRLELKISGTHDLPSTALPVDHLSLTNENLIHVYPKLDIKIVRAVYDWAIDMRTGGRIPHEPLYVTLRLTITNHRTETINLDTFKLLMNLNRKSYLSFAENSVYIRRYTSSNGVETAEGENRENLKQTPPLSLNEEQSVAGTLQFIFKEAELGNYGIVADALNEPISLEGNQVTLLLVDQNNEKHQQHAMLTKNERYEAV